MHLHPTPNSGGQFEPELVEGRRGGPEIHSDKAHRCVDKVGAKGHATSNSWAICTSSIGKRGVYAKGHGGNANPKRKINEATAELDAVADELKETWTDAARMGALCARTKKPEHCAKAAAATKKAISTSDPAKKLKAEVNIVKNALKGDPEERRKWDEASEEGRAEDREYYRTLTDRSKDSEHQTIRDNKQRAALGIPWYKPLPDTIRSRGKKRDLDAQVEREYEHAAQSVSPVYVYGPKKGKRKKDWSFGLGHHPEWKGVETMHVTAKLAKGR